MKSNLLKTAVIAVLIAISTNVHAFTAVTSGAWSNAATWGGIGPGTSVSNQDIDIPSGITVNLDVDVTFSTLLLNSFNVDGSLTGTSNSVMISSGSFTGSGNVTIERLVLTGLLTTSSYSGSLTLNTLRNELLTLTLTGATTISDTLDLETGNVALGTGGNLSVLANGVVRVNDGSITSTGGVFSGSNYDVLYYGTSKTTGIEVNSTTLDRIYIDLDDMNQVLTQGMNNLIVNGDFDLNVGQYNIGANHLTLKGDYTQNVASQIVSTATTDLTIEGSGPLTSNMKFTAASTIRDIEINRTNSDYKLGSDLSVAGTIYLTNGHFNLNIGTLTMLAGSAIQIDNGNFQQLGGSFDGTASYDVDYIGGTTGSQVEITGAGLNDVSVNLSSTTDTLRLNDDVTVNGDLDMSVGLVALNGYDLTIDGTYQQNSSAVFVGNSSSSLALNLTTSNTDTLYLGGGNRNLELLTINIGVGNTLFIANDLNLYEGLELTTGRVEIENSTMNFRSGAEINGYNNIRYIVISGTGRVEREVYAGGSFVDFPVGTSTDYSPAFIQQGEFGSSGSFSVGIMDDVLEFGDTGNDVSTSQGVVDKTWTIEAPTVAVMFMDLRLGWTAADEVNGFDRTRSRIRRYNQQWDNYPASAATAGPNGTFESRRDNITSGGLFSVADSTVTLTILDQQLDAAVNVYPNPTVDMVTVSTGDLHANYLYEVFDAAGNKIASVANADAVNKFSFEAYSNGFYFIKITDLSTNAAVTKRIVKN